MVSQEVVISISNDIEMKLALLVSKACEFESRIYFISKEKRINAKSIMGMMSLIVENGEMMLVSAEGRDESDAVKSITELLMR